MSLPISLMQEGIKQLRSRFAALRDRWVLLLLWPALGGAAIFGLWQLEASHASQELATLQRDALQSADRLARSYAMQVGGSLEKIDILTSYVKNDWERPGDRVSLELLRRQGVFSAERFDMLSIIGGDGRVQTSVLSIPVDKDFSIRPYFKHHQQNSDNALLVSVAAPEAPTEQQNVYVTRRLNRPDGGFDGVIVAVMQRDLFEPLSANPALNEHGFKALVGNDSAVRFATVDSQPASRAQLDAMRRDECRVGKAPVRLDAACFVDGQPRYVAAMALAHHPFQAVIGLSEQVVLAPHRAHARANRDLVTVCSMLIIFFSVFAWLLTIRIAMKRKSESHIRMAYRLATENGKDGFFLWKRVRNRFGKVVDFRIVDCNEFGARMYHMTRDTLIGKTITDIYGMTRYRDIVIASGIQMDYDGAGESEYAVLPESKMDAEWLHLTYARTYEGIAVTLRDISEKISNHNEITRRATHDALTDLPNRYWLTKSLPAMMKRAAHNDEKLAVMFIDLDKFKRVNDLLGHAAGDVVLREVADRLQSLMRPGDRVVRLGGDEFIILLDRITDEESIAMVAERIVSAFKTPFIISDTEARVGTSIGIAQFPRDGDDTEVLLHRADAAMYMAKSTKTGYSFFNAVKSIEPVACEEET